MVWTTMDVIVLDFVNVLSFTDDKYFMHLLVKINIINVI